MDPTSISGVSLGGGAAAPSGNSGDGDVVVGGGTLQTGPTPPVYLQQQLFSVFVHSAATFEPAGAYPSGSVFENRTVRGPRGGGMSGGRRGWCWPCLGIGRSGQGRLHGVAVRGAQEEGGVRQEAEGGVRQEAQVGHCQSARPARPHSAAAPMSHCALTTTPCPRPLPVQLSCRITPEWGSHDLVEAERLLYRAALEVGAAPVVPTRGCCRQPQELRLAVPGGA